MSDRSASDSFREAGVTGFAFADPGSARIPASMSAGVVLTIQPYGGNLRPNG